jgi:parallel beta-helix repeat protein
MDINSAAGSAIRGLGVIHYASGYNASSLTAAALRVNSPNVTVEGCTIAYNATAGMIAFGRNGIVRNNTFVFNGGKGLGGYKADFLLMTGSTFSYNNTEHFGRWDAAGAKLVLSANMTWRNNRFENNFAPGGWLHTSCYDSIIVSNVFKGNLSQGLKFEISNKAIIASNLFVGNRDAGLQVVGSSDVQAYNNTFVNNGNQIAVIDDSRTNSDPLFTWNTYDVTLRNNLFYSGVASAQAIYVRDVNSNPLRNAAALLSSSDYNAYYRSSTSATPSLVSWWNGTRQNLYSTVYAFRTATGNEAHSLAFDNMADPFFVSAAQGNYTLRSDSRAKRAGQPLPADVATAIGVSAGVAVDLGRLK